jgi:hypothetical protein
VTIWVKEPGPWVYKNCAVLTANKNYGSMTKFAVTPLLPQDYVLIVDDDVKPLDGFMEQLVADLLRKGGDRPQDAVTSIYGRFFSRPRYKREGARFADQILADSQVHFIGRLYFGHRSNFMVDVRGCDDNILDDLWWSLGLRRQKPLAKMFIAPNKRWENMPYANDNNSISRNGGFYQIRNNFVADHFEELTKCP